MTNSKFRIKSEIRNPNGKLWRPMSSFGHLSFVILSTFVHPPQCCLLDRVQLPQCRSGKLGHPRQHCYGGRVIRISSFSRASSRRLLQAMNKTNIEHQASNAEHRSRGHATCTTVDVRCSMFSVRCLSSRL